MLVVLDGVISVHINKLACLAPFLCILMNAFSLLEFLLALAAVFSV